ncbi:MAG: hypothetical protein AAFR96_08795 [Planctomycetota bacterium]
MDDLRAKAHNLKVWLAGTVSRAAFPPAHDLYADATDQDASTRNPVVVIPGIMGSRLRDRASGRVLWGGKDKQEFADPTDPEQLRMISLPLDPHGAPLRDRVDYTMPDGSIDQLKAKVFGFPVSVHAYGPILQMLGVGGFFMDQNKGKNKLALNYSHRSIANCFEFAYDWRRSVVDNVERLDAFIKGVLEFAAYDAGENARDNLRVDIVAHSMAGLLTRYYLRYGTQKLPDDGSLPELDWSGGNKVEHAILVGTPSAGSHASLERLMTGLPESPATPHYDPAVLCTYPSIYQLLPRARHKPYIDEATGESIDDLMEPECWIDHQWGLADPTCEPVIEHMLPNIRDRGDRRRIAIDHMSKCLDEAKRFHAALDVPANAPPHVALHLFAGDGVLTPSLASVGVGRNSYKVLERDYGDGTVLRSSALMDERRGTTGQPRVVTPIRWDAVTFVPTDHMLLTRHPTFVNNALYILLEKARPDCGFRGESEAEFKERAAAAAGHAPAAPSQSDRLDNEESSAESQEA